jgi:N-acyl-phosphatidylethanolamine-hydrolysing phospholipase D
MRMPKFILKWRTGAFTLFLLLFLISCTHNSPYFNEALWRQSIQGEKTASLYDNHFENGRYFNPWMPREHGGFIRFLKMSLSGNTRYTQEETDFRPAFVPGLKDRIKSMPPGDFISWVGHSTFLIRLNGQYILTDPIFSQRAFLPKRVTPPAITGEDINRIIPDVTVLISHNHYDHLDSASIRSLSGPSRVIVPMGLKTYVEKLHKSGVQELDWWQSIDIGHDIRIYCLPAQHWSRRLTQGENRTLWASYMIVTPETTIYFAGDSGYFAGYREFGRLFPRIDYAIIPVTALNPRFFMHYAHMNVDEALDAFRDLNAEHFVPAHWGTFEISREPAGFPLLELERRIKESDLDPSRYIIMDLGEIHALRGRAELVQSKPPVHLDNSAVAP